jgi:V/A-type H+-transporting ATPase subunit E
MSPVEGNIDLLTDAVLSEARADADKILAEAQETAAKVRGEAQGEAENERRAIIERANQNADRIRRQAVASAQLNARTTTLAEREKLLVKVFDTANQQLASIQQWSDYNQIAMRLLREALANLNAKNVVVHADDTAQKVYTPEVLKKLAEELKTELRLGEPLKQATGVIIETDDKRLRYDNTLETRLSRMQNSLRTSVYHLLMGETL